MKSALFIASFALAASALTFAKVAEASVVSILDPELPTASPKSGTAFPFNNVKSHVALFSAVDANTVQMSICEGEIKASCNLEEAIPVAQLSTNELQGAIQTDAFPSLFAAILAPEIRDIREIGLPEKAFWMGEDFQGLEEHLPNAFLDRAAQLKEKSLLAKRLRVNATGLSARTSGGTFAIASLLPLSLAKGPKLIHSEGPSLNAWFGVENFRLPLDSFDSFSDPEKSSWAKLLHSYNCENLGEGWKTPTKEDLDGNWRELKASKLNAVLRFYSTMFTTEDGNLHRIGLNDTAYQRYSKGSYEGIIKLCFQH